MRQEAKRRSRLQFSDEFRQALFPENKMAIAAATIC
jgi:hypothetical protein